ncbi:hypothetical protein ACP70R_032366 [Stipagrostis hirtigluma subsp. patula]
MVNPAAMAAEAWHKVTGFLHSQLNDEDNLKFNINMAKAVGLFAGSIFMMHKFGDLMAI